MTAAPERRIDIVTARLEGQRCERLSDKHRCVLIHDRSGEDRPPKCCLLCLSCPELTSEASILGSHPGNILAIVSPGTAC